MSVITPVPSFVQFLNAAQPSQQIVVTYTGYSGTISAAMLDGSFASVTPSSGSGPVVTFTVSPQGTAPISNGGDDAVVFTAGDGTSVQVGVQVDGMAPALSLLPSIQSYSGAISYVRALTDCPSTPSDALIATFLNEGLQQITDDILPIKQTVTIPVIVGSTFATLPYDIGDIEAMTYRTTPPGIAGGVEYELLELGPLQFVDSTQGMPQMYGGPSYGGPTLWYRRISDVSGRIRMEFSPQPPPGYLSISYFSRPILWDSTNPSSQTNIDPTVARVAILFACSEVCHNRKDEVRSAKFEAQYLALLASKKEKIGRRRVQRRATVRDVTSMADGFTPSWWPS